MLPPGSWAHSHPELPGQMAQGRVLVTSSLLPGLQPSSWPEVSPRTPQLALAGSCRRPGGPGRQGQLNKRRKARTRVKWVLLISPFCLYRENRWGKEPKKQLFPLCIKPPSQPNSRTTFLNSQNMGAGVERVVTPRCVWFRLSQYSIQGWEL